MALAAKASCPHKKQFQHCRLLLKNILGTRYNERLERLNITRQVAGIAFVVHIFANVGVVDDAVLMILSSVKMVTKCHNKALIPKTVDLNDRDFLVRYATCTKEFISLNSYSNSSAAF